MSKDEKVQELIEDMALEVRRMYNITTPIESMRDVLNKLGIEVDVVYFNWNAYDDFEIIKKSNNTILVKVNGTYKYAMPYHLAQALGTLILDMGFLTDDIAWSRVPLGVPYKKDSNKVAICNRFAYSFLMPKEEFLAVMRDNMTGCNVNTRTLARHFNVSPAFISDRGYRLGVFKW